MADETITQLVLHGVAASPGIAEGPTLVYMQKDPDVPLYTVPEAQREREVKRFESAILSTRDQIMRLRADVEARLGAAEAHIFEAHLLVLEDPALIEETIREQRTTNHNIETCLQRVVRRYIEVFSQMDDEYIKERVTDIRDVARRLLQTLLGLNTVPLGRMTEPRVIVAEDLTPSDTAALDRVNVLAFVTDMGSRTSHTVIMARSMQVPAVVGLRTATSQIPNGAPVIVDGYEGLVIINPTEETRLRYGRLAERRRELQRKYERIATLSSLTADKKPFILHANIGGPEDLSAVKRSGAEGIGLFRTENVFIRTDRIPSEDEQFEIYREVVAQMSPLPVTIRTVDLGGDKTNTHYRFVEEETNPFMGFRAIRFCLEKPEVFKDQLRAILRASAFGKVKLMFPMISGLEELLKAKELLEEARAELRARGVRFDEHMAVGAMLEVPSAALIVDLLAPHCDFFSVGTNDLIQYTIAIDRVNNRVAHMYDPTHPAVLRTLANILKMADQARVPVSVCGEMAGESLYAPLLLGLGVESLSASPALLPEIKYFVRHMRMKDMQKVAHEVVGLGSSAKAYGQLKRFLFSQLTEQDPHEAL